jgi:exosome complex RNA-binding protein Csl4
MKLVKCGNCGTQLTGKQQMWCSPACANEAWNREHREERNEYQRNLRAGNKPLTQVEQLALQVTILERENRNLKGLCANCATPLKRGQVAHCSPECANADWQRDEAARLASNATQRAVLTAALTTKESK